MTAARALRALWLGALAAAVACSGPSGPGHPGVGHGGAPVASPGGPPPLFDDLGRFHRPVSTRVPRAQAYFDQGQRLIYAFNHAEAQRAFEEAVRLDPTCAICHWGIALSLGPNYNSPADEARDKAAMAAIQRAQQRAGGARPAERALIEALAARHSGAGDADRRTRAAAYADAMRGVAARFPDDTDASTLLADALMNLRPWDLWTIDGQPEPGTLEAVAALERALARDPNHPGAAHLYIHAVEASPDPGRAAGAADRLARLMPGAGHLVHMPSHIYFRVGRYADAHAVNVRAVEADRAYFKRQGSPGLYRMTYYPHNIDFIWHAAAMEGRRAETLRGARELAASMPVEMVLESPDMEPATAAPLGALARFGRWAEILAEPAPPAGLLYTTGVWRYARGLALCATNRGAEARRELEALRELIGRVPAERTVAGFFKTTDMLGLAADVLSGEIAGRGGDTDTGVRHLQEAVRRQDRHWFTEPPPWYFPVRQALGAVLLAGGRAGEAEAVYREDLRRNPDNGWSLHGLARSLRAQGKDAEAAAVDARFRTAWARADVVLTASRF